MKVIPVPNLSDNYAYLIICEATGKAGVVDPAEADPIERALSDAGVEMAAILNTHHHWDHIGGNKDLLAAHPGIPVYGHASDKGRIDGQTHFLESGDTFTLGDLTVKGLHNPGHTSGAISYAVENAVFTGDTLFAGGCGRLFEGTAADMHRSLCEVLGGLPPETLVYFGHEYTEANLRFAAHVEPDNQAVADRLTAVRKTRAEGRFTTPSTLAEEWATNPFMRSDSTTIQAAIKDTAADLSPVAVLGAVRALKDSF